MARKRGHGEGSVFKNANGTWRGQIMDGYDSDGKTIRVSFSGRTKSEVLTKIQEYKKQKEEHIIRAVELTVAQWAETWYAGYKTQVQPSTYSGYQHTLNRIKEGMGKLKVQDVITLDINKFLDSLAAKDYSSSMIRKCRAMLI